MAISKQTQYQIAEILLLVVAAVSGAIIVINLLDPAHSIVALFIGGMVFTASLILSIRLWLDPDRVRASQSDAMLNLASQTLGAMSDEGFDSTSAQNICDLLLPKTSAVAVAITDQETILGYAGRDREYNEVGSPIRTAATHATVSDGHMRIIRTADDIGIPEGSGSIKAAIIVPLKVGNDTIGTLKFYYPSSRRLNETQQSIAQGFGDLVSTQIAAKALEDQKKLATTMELRALQSQINPHFLFNTINTIASLIRTDPDKARLLLRDFATFYRSTLENATDLITLEREIEQTQRYVGFEIARFGEDRLAFSADIPDVTAGFMIPSFMIQPLVENAVRHAMPSEGQLAVSVRAEVDECDLFIFVEDNGVGIPSAANQGAVSQDKPADLAKADTSSIAHQNAASQSTSDGLGIAMKNIRDRVKAYYGPDSAMRISSKEGEGTTVVLKLQNACLAHPVLVE